MDVLLLMAIAALGMILITETTQGKAMLDWPSQTAIGAMVGSVLSAWWRKAIRWQANVVAGFFIGWWGGDYLIMFLDLPNTVETARAAGSGLGLIGFSLLDFVMSVNWGQLAGKALDKAAQMRGAK